jgi:hypothetical protein
MEETNEIMKVFITHLKKKGLDLRMIPVFIRDLAHAINNDDTLWKINRSLHLLGWIEFEMDYRTLELADACLESSTLFSSDGRSERFVFAEAGHGVLDSF